MPPICLSALFDYTFLVSWEAHAWFYFWCVDGSSVHVVPNGPTHTVPCLPRLQARLRALELLEVLFARSKAARGQIAANFEEFMHLTVGHHASHPLPGPPVSAVQLRELGLALVEAWRVQYGRFYPQVWQSIALRREAGGCCSAEDVEERE